MNKQRYDLAARLRAEKKTFRQIGEALGVGPQRAREMVMKAERMKNAGAHWTDGLSTRTGFALRRAGFESREALESTIAAKGLKVGDFVEIGPKAIAEIRQWLGLEECAVGKPATEVAIRRAIAMLERNGYRVEKAANA